MCQNECHDLNTCLYFATSKLARAFSKLADEAFAKTGLSPSHAVILYTINKRKKMPQKDLGELLNLTPSTVTRLIDKLQMRGYVEKESDGKAVCLMCTEKGLAEQETITEAWNTLHQSYDAYLTDEERQQFLNVSQKLLEQMIERK